MPHGKPSRLKLLKHSGEHHHAQEPPPDDLFHEDAALAGEEEHSKRWFNCCTPRSCRAPNLLIDAGHPGSSVRVVCNSDDCTESDWMHSDCFEG